MVRIISLLFSIILLAGCGCETSYYEVKASDNLNKITLNKVDSIKLQSGMDTIGFVKKLQVYRDKFFIVDPFYAKKAMLFDSKGKLLQKFGKRGQGPGETPILMNGVISDKKVFLYGNYRVNVYDLGGGAIKQLTPPVKGICNNMYPDGDGGFYLLSFHRSNKSRNTIYKYDGNFNLLNSFATYDNGIPYVLDTFFPQASLCFKDEYIYQVFNYKYEIMKYNKDGDLVQRVKLKSPFYTAPDLSKRNVYGHIEDRKYRASFTQITGLYKWDNGFIVSLTNWKDVKTSQVIYEFWSEKFEYQGYAEPGREQMFGAVKGCQLVMVEPHYEHTQINIYEIKL